LAEQEAQKLAEREVVQKNDLSLAQKKREDDIGRVKMSLARISQIHGSLAKFLNEVFTIKDQQISAQASRFAQADGITTVRHIHNRNPTGVTGFALGILSDILENEAINMTKIFG
jgi:hypothetical protein